MLVEEKGRQGGKQMNFPDLQEVRRNAGLYLPMLDTLRNRSGVHLLFDEVLRNAVDAAVCGHGHRIDVGIYNGGRCAVIRDYGRGIPHGQGIGWLTCFGTKLCGSLGTEKRAGIGIKIVNALSSRFAVRSYRAGKVESVVFERGVLLARTIAESLPAECDGTFVCFTPDSAVFTPSRFSAEVVEDMVRMQLTTVSNLVVWLNGHALPRPV